MNINGESQSIITNKIISNDGSADISLNDDVINLEADSVLINGAPIGTGGGFVTNPLSATLEANEYSINNAGAVQATVFIKNGGTSEQYLMADGSALQYSANSGNSNFYLYNSVTNQSPTPANGDISYNATEQKQATIVYISHRTRDNIDIEVFFKNISTLNEVYIQDQENSDNNITYNIIGSPTIVNQAHITIPIAWVSSSGTGTTSFGNGHNILLSFFTNSIETDTRITTLETKTQNITATASQNVFDKNSSFVLRIADSDSFTIRNDATPFSTAKFVVSNTSVQIISVPLLMNTQKITLLAEPTISTDATTKNYVDTADALKLNLTGGVLSGAITATSIIKTGGLSTEFLKANGAIDSRSMSTTQVVQVDSLSSSGVSEFNMTQIATVGSWSWADAAVGYTRRVRIHGTLSRTNNVATTWSLRIRTNGTENTIYPFPASPNTIVTGVNWVMDITWSRYQTGALMWNIRWNSSESTSTGYWTTRTQNVGGNVVALGVSAAYTITMQSNVATSSLNVIHANVQNIYTG